MADRYTGREVRPTFGTMTKLWKTLGIEETEDNVVSKGADSKFKDRVATDLDAKMTIKGIDSDDAAGMSFADVHALIGKSPSALTFTDAESTPVSKLRPDFFTDYPLARWRVTSVGGEWSNDPADWSVTLMPRFLNAPRA